MSDDRDDMIPFHKEQQAPQEKNQPQAGPVTFSASQQLSYHSPIPPPQVLAGYNTFVSPDAGDRLLKLVERQQEHRQYIEKTVIDGDSKRANTGLWLGSLIVLATVALTAYLAKLGQPAPGIATIITELAVLGGVFVYGSKQREKERRDRLESLTKQRPADQTTRPPDLPQIEQSPKRKSRGRR